MTALLTNRILLVPYSEQHVPAYHTWMQDPAIREATASEPLTLEEEYAMQRSWRVDTDKLTFIVCLPPEDHAVTDRQHLVAGVEDADARMVGDVNLFMYEFEGAASDELDQSPHGANHVMGELEVMIARADCQGRGLGRHILLVFMSYVLDTWAPMSLEQTGEPNHRQLAAFCAKIGASNTRSIQLFERLGFGKITSEPNYFGEWELRWSNDQANRDRLARVVAAEIGEPRVLRYEEAAVNR